MPITHALLRMAMAATAVIAIGACANDVRDADVIPAIASTEATVRAVSPANAATVSSLSGYSAYAAVLRHAADVWSDASTVDHLVGHFDVRNENGVPQTFLIRGERRVGDDLWYEVLLPIRPNGSSGWVRASDVAVVGLRYRLEVHLDAFRIDLVDGEQIVESFPIGVGTDQTPTPGGTYYIKELLQPPDPNTIYGPYVFGLSGFSNVLQDWPGGGVLGLHGNNDPTSIGAKVSHGCVRMRNEDISRLARLLPLGTPVIVSA